jgi:hypothetical protein
MSTYSRLYAGADGESHFEDVEIELVSTEYAPPTPPLDLSSFTPATQFGFMRARRPAGQANGIHQRREISFSCSTANGKLPRAMVKRGALRPAACCSPKTRAEKWYPRLSY